MIFVERNRIEPPQYFLSKKHRLNIEDLKAFYSEKAYRRAQREYTLAMPIKPVQEVLEDLFNYKCAYCETPIDSTAGEEAVDWFRPRSHARNMVTTQSLEESYDLDHYWWLTYEWENLYHACPICLRNKATWFPVIGERSTPGTPFLQLVQEEHYVLIDPCQDDVASHFEYDLKSGEISPKTKRAEITIDLLQLNRGALKKNRLRAVREEKQFWKDRFSKKTKKGTLFSFKNRIDSIFSASSMLSTLAYLGIRRFFYQSLMRENSAEMESFMKYGAPSKETLEFISKDTTEVRDEKGISDQGMDKEAKALKRFEIKQIQLFNFKCFKRFQIKIPETKRYFSNTDTKTIGEGTIERSPWLVFLGENGVGKSSLLKAIAIALMDEGYLKAANLDPEELLRYEGKQGCIIIKGKEADEKIKVSFWNKSETNKGIETTLKEPLTNVFAYGAVRLQAGRDYRNKIQAEMEYGNVKTLNLFDPSIALLDGTKWLLESNRAVFEAISKTIKSMLLLDEKDRILRNRTEKKLTVLYGNNRDKVELKDLSDGYQSIFALVTDLIQILAKDHLRLVDAEGIVLIDEIGAHLHPRWKMEIIERLRRVFPKVQFIITTHEPLCLRGLNEGEVVVLKNVEEKVIISVDELPDPSEFRVDQLLTSEFFGLNSTMDAEMEKDFNTYYMLLAKDELNDQERAKYRELKNKLPNRKHLGSSIRDELVYYVVDTLLAKQVKNSKFKIINTSIKKEAVKRTKELWDELNNTLQL